MPNRQPTNGTSSPCAYVQGKGEPHRVDVLVIGGGTAGTVAAIQSARAGADTMLVERGPQLGGTLTTGGVNFPGLFHAWGKQIIAGIGWELVRKTVELDGGTLPDFSTVPKAHWMHQIRVNGGLYAALAEEQCLEAGVDIRYGQFPLAVTSHTAGWNVDLAGPGTSHTVSAKQLIDCTGGAHVCGMAGLQRRRDEITQPGTLAFQLTGYDVDSLDAERIQRHYLEALQDGRLRKGDFAASHGNFVSFLRQGGRNAQHIFGADTSTADALTQANIAGRQSLLRIIRFTKSLPGCEQVKLERVQPETAVRETFRIVGKTTVTVEDYVSGRIFNDAIAYAFYPVDLHDKDGVRPEPLSPGIVPTVPFGALVPDGSQNILAAGRSVSSDRLANSALRVQAPCMAMGQAAGAAAALAVRESISSGDVDIEKLRSLLRSHGVIVP